MKTFKPTAKVVKHLHEGQMAMAKVESAGVRVDKGYLDKAIADVQKEIADDEAWMQSGKEWRDWKKAFGEKAKLGSRPQLAELVYGKWGYKAEALTATGRVKADKRELDKVDIPFVKRYVEAEEKKKACNTFLFGIRKEIVERGGDWFLHPSYSLNKVTNRSSCSDPNWQNQPNRNERIARMVRECFIPRKGRYFVEIDYAQIEVRIAACYNRDPALVRYIKDERSDMHFDTALDLFLIKPEQVHRKTMRLVAKNMFVFPEFYGSVYFQCAPAIWDQITRGKYRLGKDADGPLVVDHLKSKGITRLGDCDPDARDDPKSFVYHLKKVEEKLWKRFKVYKQWRYDYYDEYQRNCGMQSLFGFAWNNILLNRNDVVNYPIQGDAFHCLLWSLIRVQRAIERYKMRSLIVGEIHDSMQLDASPRELQDVLDICDDTMIRRLMKEHEWITVPIKTEVEVAPVSKSWFHKKVWDRRADGTWALKN